MNPPELSVLKFANECTIALKQVKIRSFSLFHRCQLSCVRDLNNQQSEQCFKACEHDLEEFYKFKKNNKVENSSFVFYHLPVSAYETEQANTSQALTSEQAREYHHKCLETEVKLKDYIKKLNQHLDDLNTKYLKK